MKNFLTAAALAIAAVAVIVPSILTPPQF